jgi:23S rRNA (cytidine1920-2'-O)/16S rRNA (cytidine1409-2'-O)-methyltransferase
MRIRADLLLVSKGLFESRAKAREAIEAGLVRMNGQEVKKASDLFNDDVEIEAEKLHPWVSRGGLKLEAALQHFRIDVRQRIALDIGASTGGFTDVLIARGARRVYAVDVGHHQLHQRLRHDPHVLMMEGRDARSLTEDDLQPLPSLIVCDASFISLKLVLNPALDLVTTDTELIALIKPQFEVGRARVGKGVVRDDDILNETCRDIEVFLTKQGWSVIGLMPSPILGGDGNREFLIAARKTRP